MSVKRIYACLTLTSLVCTGLNAPTVAANELTAFTSDRVPLDVFRQGDRYVSVEFPTWAPGWKYIYFRGPTDVEGKTVHTRGSVKLPKQEATAVLERWLQPVDKQSVSFTLDLSADRDAAFTLAAMGVNTGAAFEGGKVTLVPPEGDTAELELPFGRGTFGLCKELQLRDVEGDLTRITLDPPLKLSYDGQARIALAGERLPKDQPTKATVTFQFPSNVTFYPSLDQVPQEGNMDQWFPFTATCDMTKPSELDAADWIEKPAGKHGRIKAKDDVLIYNGKPIKLWGLNLCYNGCCPDKELADQRALFYTRYGVNAVRLHKYADGTSGIQTKDSFLQFDPEKLDCMDYQVAKFKEYGIYTKLSSTFHVKLGPKDLSRVPYADEFGNISRGNRLSTGTGAIYLSEELQDLQIEQVVKILKHKNPYTGLTYAEDPCIAVVELFNEDSVLFGGTQKIMARVPSLKERAGHRFYEWLKTRYGSKEKLLEAWGEEAWDSFAHEKLTGDNWEKGIIYPAGGHPWYVDPKQLEDSQKFRKRRLFDTMLFLYELQNEFYSRYVKALRDTGYEGEILASNWQAGRAFSHYYNLHSDSLVGLIDRHNYFGGGRGMINNASMLSVPGSGMLSSGMQQVANRPFMLSEWIHVYPNEWGVEGPALIGAYGMGLQGWDVSYIFQNRDRARFKDALGKGGHDVWEVMAPQVFGVFPAVARQVLRGDVKESEATATRYVHIPSLHMEKLGFMDEVTQAHDVKTFNSDKVPAEALAVVRCAIEFSDVYRDTPAFPIEAHQPDGTLVSSTGQLTWCPGKSKMDGYVTIDTPATKAVVGFADGATCRLGEITIEPDSRYGAIYVTAQKQQATVRDADALLVVAIARARNTGMKVHADRLVVEKGDAPILMEPVRANITLDRPGTPTVHILDHDGARTEHTLPVKNGTISIDTGRDKTCYYLVSY